MTLESQRWQRTSDAVSSVEDAIGLYKAIGVPVHAALRHDESAYEAVARCRLLFPMVKIVLTIAMGEPSSSLILKITGRGHVG